MIENQLSRIRHCRRSAIDQFFQQYIHGKHAVETNMPYDVDWSTSMTKPAAQVEILECRECVRLVLYREEVAETKVRRFRDWNYWGKPVPSLGDVDARLMVVGLAPAAHGGNRTGRIFTGDRSGDWLFRALHATGFANQPSSTALDDGLELSGLWITAPVRCAPPANKPTTIERDTCRPFIERELALLPHVRVLVPLGLFAYQSVASLVGLRPRP